jgi:hypothetical protein
MACKNNTILHLLFAIGIFFSFSSIKPTEYMDRHTDELPGIEKPGSFLEILLKSNPQYFEAVLKKKDEMNVQVIYTQVNRDAKGAAMLEHHYYNVNPGKYFYPASTVKLPVVLLALQKLNELKHTGIDRNTTMLTEVAFSGQTAVYNDPTAADGKPSIAHYIKKILLVSDNDAYNRLYEFLGQEYINAEMKKKGYAGVQVVHRLNVFLTEEENRNTNPVTFFDRANRLLYKQAGQQSGLLYQPGQVSLGKGFYKDNQLINTPMDFSKKNRISLDNLHKIMIGLFFPDKVRANERFNISEDDRQFVLKYMSQYPTESIYPPYAADTVHYWPAHSKFILFGGEKGKLPAYIRSFNKEGDAYGHLIDLAYLVDFKNKIEFFVSAVIYCNSNGILNDDKYDYDSVGKPFMKNLGKAIYEYELKRNYKIRPDLSSVLFTYDN